MRRLSTPRALRRRVVTGLSTIVLLSPAAANGQASPTEPAVPEKEGKVLHATRVAGPAPVIDGALDEQIWARADSTGAMVQWEPENMAPMTERTVVRVAYDDRYVYVAARLYDADAAGIVRGVGRRDEAPASDGFHVGFDTQHDHATGYVFSVNPSGVQGDSYFFDDTSNDSDYTAVWEVEARVAEDGWTAEFRIPFSQMRFHADGSERVVWGFDFRRTIQRKNEQGQWVGRPRGVRGQVSRWGHLVFADGLPSPRRLEALPFAVARGAGEAGAEFEPGFDSGLDLRAGLGTGATLAATFNPDFGQVEADPAVLNLTVFETFLPEKRPFFLEDSRVFVPSYGLFQLFHSRRIGRRPSYFRPFEAGDVVLERPDQTTIVGAGKITGKGAGYTYGVVSAVTAAEHAVVQTGAGARVERLLEPRTSYNAVRLQRDLFGSSNVGLLGTGVLRDGAPDAFAGGVDYRLRWDRNRWEWNGHWAVTDAPAGGEQVRGLGGVTNFGFNSKRFDFNLRFDHFSRNFRVTDLGFLRTRVDRTSYGLFASYGNPDPGPRLRSWSFNTMVSESRNGDGLIFDRSVAGFGNAQLLNYWRINAGAGYSPDVLDDLDTRGGPPILEPSNVFGHVTLNSDPRKSWSLWLGSMGSYSALGGWHRSHDIELELRPSPRFQFALNGGYQTARDEAQWIGNRDVDGDGVTDHLYGRLRRNVINLTLRATAALDRDLTFQAYVQPFVAVGDYDDVKRLARPSSFEFEPVDPAGLGRNPDFNTKSLRGTFVLRWEYVRGSTLYAVWSFDGSDPERPGVFQPLRDLGDVLGVARSNALMLKVNYWLSW